jgi:hypothetical protein
MAKLTELIAGFCTHPGCIAIRGAGCARMRFPARAWLIERRRGRFCGTPGTRRLFCMLHGGRSTAFIR